MKTRTKLGLLGAAIGALLSITIDHAHGQEFGVWRAEQVFDQMTEASWTHGTSHQKRRSWH